MIVNSKGCDLSDMFVCRFQGQRCVAGGAAAEKMRKTVAARREKVYNGRERSREGFL